LPMNGVSVRRMPVIVPEEKPIGLDGPNTVAKYIKRKSFGSESVVMRVAGAAN
jgi:hypothetical protein